MNRLAETTICGLIRLFSRLIIIALPILPVPYSQGWPIGPTRATARSWCGANGSGSGLAGERQEMGTRYRSGPV
jgi:hypothetical protein